MAYRSSRRTLVHAGSVALFGSMSLTAAAQPATAPEELHGKSIVVSWSENRVQRHVGEPKFYRVNANQTMSIYISSAGRVFARLNLATGAGLGSVERVQGEQRNNPTFRNWEPTFDGKSMVLTQPFNKGGMRKLEIEFDEARLGCKSKVLYVKEPGAETSLAWSPITKKMVEFQSIAMLGEVCSVKIGNVFGE